MLRRQEVDLYVIIHHQLQRTPSRLHTQAIPNLLQFALTNELRTTQALKLTGVPE